MDPGARRLWLLVAAAIALLAGVAAFWLAYHRRPPEPPVVVVTETPPTRVTDESAPENVLPSLAGRVLVVGCRQGECRWSRVARVEEVATGPQGALRRLVAREGTSRYADEAPEAYNSAVPIEWVAADHSDYAFCSRERPAYAFPDEEGHYLLHYLDLFDLAGFQLASARAYMRICHDEQYDGEDTALLQRLGYRPGTRNEQVENGNPRDLARF
ncbi:MAG TPA: hypothetical protein VIT38_13180 [Allosphingosinicella sp.]|jgi:hypothetical protein